MDSKAKFFIGALVASLSMQTFTVSAQETQLPPISRAIDRETGPTRTVEVTNETQNAPVLIGGSLTLGTRSYGQGYITLKNTSDRPIVAFRGAWEVLRDNKTSVRHHWDVGGPTLVFNGGMQPGDVISFPIPGPATEDADHGQQLVDVSPLITGVVFFDKSTWGLEGESLRGKLIRDQKVFVSIAEQLRQASYQLSPREFASRAMARDFTAPNSSAFFPDIHTQMMFNNIILDDDQTLRRDAAERLDRVIERLKPT